MKKIITKIILTLILVTSIVFIIPTSYTNAAGPTGSGVKTGEVSNDSGFLSKIFAFSSLPDLFNSAIANIANLAMAGAGMLLAMSAYILDVSIRLTLNIKTFVDSTPVIYSVWRILRDITGLFFIFYLIYAAIQMIIGVSKGPSYGATIKSIIVAGVLINFSFFIVSVTIDFSNVLSQTIYRAMVPNTKVLSINPNTGISTLVSEAGSSNISNIFMNSLRIQNIYDTNGNKLGTQIGDPVKIALIGLAGVIMMITTAASFVLASLAFIARFIILIFLLAFSSLCFVGSVIPQIKNHLKFWSRLWDQLIFMPVYLLLMYVGLSIVNGSNLLLGANNTFNTLPTGTNWLMPYIILAVNFTIVIFILNLPLVVALGLGGHATSWFKSSIDKWDAKGVWKNVGMWTRDKAAVGAWNNTGGRVASTLSKNEGFKDFASRSKIGELALKGARGASGTYDKKLSSQIKARTDFAESLGYDETKVLNDQNILGEIKKKQAKLKSIGLHDDAKALNKNITEVEKRIAEEKNKRKMAYSERINSGNPETLWSKVARKDKAAAAKIQLGVLKTKLEKENKSLEKIRDEIKSKNDALGKLKNKIKEQKDPETPGQTARINELEKDIKDLTLKEEPALVSVTDIEDQIAQHQNVS